MTRKKRGATQMLAAMRQHRYSVYILTNAAATVFYVGMTNDLQRRIVEHKEEVDEGFTKRYNVHRLVYYEEYTDVRQAIAREKQLKHWRRAWKVDLIRRVNPSFRDLAFEYP